MLLFFLSDVVADILQYPEGEKHIRVNIMIFLLAFVPLLSARIAKQKLSIFGELIVNHLNEKQSP